MDLLSLPGFHRKVYCWFALRKTNHKPLPSQRSMVPNLAEKAILRITGEPLVEVQRRCRIDLASIQRHKRKPLRFSLIIPPGCGLPTICSFLLFHCRPALIGRLSLPTPCPLSRILGRKRDKACGYLWQALPRAHPHRSRRCGPTDGFILLFGFSSSAPRGRNFLAES